MKSNRRVLKKSKNSLRKPRKSLRKSVRKPRKSVRKSVRKLRKSVRKSARKLIKSVRKSARKLIKSVRKTRKTRKTRKSVRKSSHRFAMNAIDDSVSSGQQGISVPSDQQIVNIENADIEHYYTEIFADTKAIICETIQPTIIYGKIYSNYLFNTFRDGFFQYVEEGVLLKNKIENKCYYIGPSDGTHFTIPEIDFRNIDNSGIHFTDRTDNVLDCQRFRNDYNYYIETSENIPLDYNYRDSLKITGISTGSTGQNLCKFYFNNAETFTSLYYILISYLHVKYGENNRTDLYKLLIENKILENIILDENYFRYLTQIFYTYILALTEICSYQDIIFFGEMKYNYNKIGIEIVETRERLEREREIEKERKKQGQKRSHKNDKNDTRPHKKRRMD